MNEETSRSDQLEERFIEFGVQIFQLTKDLPKAHAYRHIGLQILRSGTAAAPNYAEARGAESRADFIHKLRIVQKELNETSVWLRFLRRIVAEKSEKISAILAENRELAKIVTASIKTSRARLHSSGPRK
jgi:four helix bundle protein